MRKLVLVAAHALAIYFFTRGFFLTRFELQDQSRCADMEHITAESRAASSWSVGSPEQPSCWAPARFRKLLFVVIDALRYDFVRSVPGERNRAEQHNFHNQLPATQRILATDPRARLFKFIADPPTVTMQRLKGLTSGSLPTFIDIRDNFASPEIAEDNLIVQAAQLGKRSVFLGDDTWMNLFPSSFNVSHPFPSFNVKDLHTVDDGVLQHLLPAVVNETLGPWDVMVAHFLGVDHVGHRFGPDHAAMRWKLRQMDDVIAALHAQIENDTLVAVLGDHGMTSDGNHGGATDEETAAALMLFSKQPLFYSGLAHELRCPDFDAGAPSSDPTAPLDAQDASHDAWFRAHHTVHQVDLVPTLAYWMGLPIPFGNIGSVVPDAIFSPAAVPSPSGVETPGPGPVPRMHRPGHTFPVTQRGRARSLGRPIFRPNSSLCGHVHEHASRDGLAALAANAWQVRRNLHSYAEVAPSFSARERNELDELFASGQRASHPSEARAALTRFLHRAALLCRVAWTQFDLPAMTRGIVVLVLTAIIGLSNPRMEAVSEGGWRSMGVAAVLGGVAAWAWSPQLAREEMEPLVQMISNSLSGRAEAADLLGFRWSADPVRPWVFAAAPSFGPLGDMALGSPVGSACLAVMLFLCGRSLWALGSTGKAATGLRELFASATFPELSVVVVAGFRLYILFSNSYIVAENNVVLYLLNTLILVMGYWLVQSGERTWTAALLTLVAAGAPRLAREFDTHAQEGIRACLLDLLYCRRVLWTLTHAVGLRFASFFPAEICLFRTMLPVVCWSGLGMWIAWREGSRSWSATFRRMSQCLQCVAAASGVLFWLLQESGSLDQWGAGLRQFFPRLVFGVGAVAVAVQLAVARRSWRWEKPDAEEAGMLPAEDLFLAFIAALPPVMLLLGPWSPLSLVLFAVHVVAVGLMMSRGVHLVLRRWGRPPSPLGTIGLLSLLLHLTIWHFFFGTGHRTQFNSLHYACPFVGFDTFNYWRGAVMLSLNTFASPLLAVLLGAPLLVASGLQAKRPQDSRTATPACGFRMELLDSILGATVGVFAAATAATALFVFYARRHLMVWAIFAPKYMFDGAMLLAVDAVALLVSFLLS